MSLVSLDCFGLQLTALARSTADTAWNLLLPVKIHLNSGSTVFQARLPWWHTLQVAATWEAEAGLLEASLGKTYTFKKSICALGIDFIYLYSETLYMTNLRK